MKKLALSIIISTTLLSSSVVFAQVPYTNITGSGADAALQSQQNTNSQTLQQVSNNAQGTCRDGTICYTPLEPFNSFDARKGGYDNFSYYVGTIFKIIISFGALSAVVLLVWGGITYIVSDAVDMKSKAKKRIQAALLGLALLTSSYLILYTINPAQLLNFNLSVAPVSGQPLSPLNLNLGGGANSTETLSSVTGGAVSEGIATGQQMRDIQSSFGTGNLDDKYILTNGDMGNKDVAKAVDVYKNYCEQEGIMNNTTPGGMYRVKTIPGENLNAPGKIAYVCATR